MSMITASTWVPRGAPAEFPTKYEVDEAELARISNIAKLQLQDAKDELDASQNRVKNRAGTAESSDMEDDADISHSKAITEADDDDLKEYDLEHYDSDTDVENEQTIPVLGNVQSLAYHASNTEDPYITLNEEEDGEEREDLQVLSSDNMLVAARVEDEVAHLEVFVYEDEADNIYVHHDIMLPAIPLSVEWLDLPVGKVTNLLDQDRRGNFVAVGTFEPDIEIWDLDTIDAMYPNAILGQGGEDAIADSKDQRLKKKKTKKSKKVNDRFHIDAVLSLAANRQHRNLLASASADKTIKLWDLNSAKCAKSYSYHTDKVCSLAWNPAQSTVLLSGSYDKTAVVADMRAPDAKMPRWAVNSDVETVRWNPHNPYNFFVTTEDGVLHYFDVRSAPSASEEAQPIWRLQAHDSSLSSFDINQTIPDLLVTGSTDKSVKLWSIQATGPSLVASRDLDVGKVFCSSFAPDPEVAFRLAVGGSKGNMQIWDTSTNAAVRRIFAGRIPSGAPIETTDRTIGVQEENDEVEDEEDLEAGVEAKRNGEEPMDRDDTP